MQPENTEVDRPAQGPPRRRSEQMAVVSVSSFESVELSLTVSFDQSKYLSEGQDVKDRENAEGGNRSREGGAVRHAAPGRRDRSGSDERHQVHWTWRATRRT